MGSEKLENVVIAIVVWLLLLSMLAQTCIEQNVDGKLSFDVAVKIALKQQDHCLLKLVHRVGTMLLYFVLLGWWLVIGIIGKKKISVLS